MASFREAFRQGRDQARAARGAPPLPRREGDAGSSEWDGGSPAEPTAPQEPGESAGENAVRLAELEAGLRESEGKLAEAKRLLAEMANYAEQMETRVVELIAGAEPMARVLHLPGVKTFLLQRFHPDKHPTADAEQRAMLTEALKTINAAYVLAAHLQRPSGGDEPQPSD